MKRRKSIILFVLFLLSAIVLGLSVNYWMAHKMTSILSFIAMMSFALAGYNFLEAIIQQDRFQNRPLFISSLIVAIMMIEVFLRLFVPSLRCYAERNGSFFYLSATSIYLRDCRECTGGDFFINDPNTSQIKNGMEFNYTHVYDKYGLRNSPVSDTTKKDGIKVIGIGDSFTEGVGAPADSTWVALLQKKCNEHSKRQMSVINAGVQGSDLIFSLHLLKECLLIEKPDVVILNLNSTDINDILARGGMDRFDNGGHFHMKTPPPLEYYFGSSFLVRFFMLHYLGYNWQVITNDQQRKEEKKAFAAISDAIQAFEKLGKENHFRFILVLQPLQNELFEKNMFADLVISPSINKLDLYPIFRAKIATKREPASTYYWPIDGHFKAAGYTVMADEIYKAEFLVK